MNKLMMVAAAAFVSAACFADKPAEGGKNPGRSASRPQMAERMRMGGGMGMGMGMGMGAGMAGDPLVWAVSNPQVAEKIGLSDEQKSKLQALKGERGANRAVQEKIRQGMNRQMELLKADTIDEAAVMAAIDEVFEARKGLAKEQTKRLIAIRQILTPEQVVKAREAMQDLRAPKGGRGARPEQGPKPKKTKNAESEQAPVASEKPEA